MNFIDSSTNFAKTKSLLPGLLRAFVQLLNREKAFDNRYAYFPQYFRRVAIPPLI